MTLCDQIQESLKDEKDDAGFKLDHHIGLSWVYCYLQICLNYIDAHICNSTLMCVYVYMYVYRWEQGYWSRKHEARGVVSSRSLADTQSIKLSSNPGTRGRLGGAKGSPGYDSRVPTFHVFSSDANTVWVVSLQAIDILAAITTPSRTYPISVSPAPTPGEDFGEKQRASLCLEEEEVPSPGTSLQSADSRAFYNIRVFRHFTTYMFLKGEFYVEVFLLCVIYQTTRFG